MSDPTRAAAFAIPVYIATGGGGAPGAGLASEIATGGTSVVVASGPISGGYIANPASDAAQGVTAENLYVDPVGDPGATDADANGTTTALVPGQSYSIPPLPAGSSLRANAASSGHKFTVVLYS